MEIANVARFTHNSSIATGADGFRIYQEGNVERFRNLEDVDYTSPVVNLSEGLVHIFGRQCVYEVRADPDVGFVVQKLTNRYD